MAGVFDLSFHQIDALRGLMINHDASNVVGAHVGDRGVVDVDCFNDQDERLVHAVITPAGHVRTSPVIGLGSAHQDRDDLGDAAA
jgi:hypothetical protein